MSRENAKVLYVVIAVALVLFVREYTIYQPVYLPDIAYTGMSITVPGIRDIELTDAEKQGLYDMIKCMKPIWNPLLYNPRMIGTFKSATVIVSVYIPIDAVKSHYFSKIYFVTVCPYGDSNNGPGPFTLLSNDSGESMRIRNNNALLEFLKPYAAMGRF